VASPVVLSDGDVLWDVVDEHLAEAAFLFEQVQRAHDSPVTTLDVLARDAEARLDAHVDALVVGADPVRDRVLGPRLREPDPEAVDLVAAAALATCAAGSLGDLVPALAHENGEVRDAAAVAFAWSASDRARRWILGRLEATGSPFERASLLRVCGSLGERVSPMVQWLQADDPVLVRAAARAALHTEPDKHRPIVEFLLDQPDEAVAQALLAPGLAWGTARAWRRCVQLATDTKRVHPVAMALYAALGRPGDHERLVGLLESPSHARAALFSLGFSGNAAVLGPLVAQVEGESAAHRKLAAQAIAMITGIEVPALPLAGAPAEDDEGPRALPPLDSDDLEADLAPAAEDALPEPDPAAIRRLCGEAALRLSSDRRWLAGQPHTPSTLVEYLGRAPLGQRHVLALSLYVRTRGGAWIDTRARTARQREQLARAESVVRGASGSPGPW